MSMDTQDCDALALAENHLGGIQELLDGKPAIFIHFTRDDYVLVSVSLPHFHEIAARLELIVHDHGWYVEAFYDDDIRLSALTGNEAAK